MYSYNMKCSLVLESLFDEFKTTHPHIDRYTFFALLEIFTRHGISLPEMIDSINYEIKHNPLSRK